MNNYMKKQSPRYSLDDSLGYLTARFSGAMLKRINLELHRQGYKITSGHFPLLVELWDQDGQTQLSLSEKLHKDKTVTSRILSSVESAGLIVRKPGKDDRREKIVHLTAAGKKVMDEVTVLVQGLLNSAKKGISKKDIVICKDVLRRAYKNIS